MKRFPFVVAAFAVAAAVAPLSVHAAGSKSTPAKPKAAAPVPRYVSLAALKKMHASRTRAGQTPPPLLQPKLDGQSLKGKNMKDLATNPPLIVINAKVGEAEAGATVDVENGEGAAAAFNVDEATIAKTGMDGQLIAQAFPPGGVRPAPIRRTPLRTVTPRWVRYPLEFQLAGIGLGTKAVDKDRFNRIDRYGLFAIHGNPTAVVVPSADGNITVTQQPPEVAGLFPNDPGGGLPDWAAAVTVKLDNNHVQWLYRRDTYSMGFVVDRLGFVDAIVVAGTYSPIAKTQLEDPIHTIQLGVDDFRKVMNRYGYPDSIETYQINVIGGTAPGETAVDVAATTGANVGATTAAAETLRTGNAAAAAATGAQVGAAAGEATGLANGNGLYRTFEVRYEQSYNIVFTIRNNRVVRIYIFGDPDFFNDQRRNNLRTQH